MLVPLNGPAVYGAISVSTATEVKVGGSRLSERAVVTIQPLDGDVYLGYDNSVSTSNGTLIHEGQVYALEATDQLPVWIIAATGTVDVRITEVS
jgi:hypothetical protein